MKLGIDVRDLKTATTGQKTYLEEICLSLTKQSSDQFQICLLDTSIPIFRGNNKLIKILEQVNLHFWKQFILPIKAVFNQCDILLCTDYFVPFLHPGFKTAVVFHDAFFYEHPQQYHRLFIWLFKHIALPSAKRCSFIITPSLYAKQQIMLYYKTLPVQNMVTIYEGPKTLPISETISEDRAILTSLHISNTPYLLHVGVMNQRKNIPFLLKAFAKLIQQGYHYQLVLAGSLKTSEYNSDQQNIIDTIQELQLNDQVILTGYLSNEALSVLYKNADLYIFPSLNEGFGLPILEAFKFNLPVLVANNSCLPEIGGDAVLSFDPFNEDDLIA
ncbi:MAG: glycosyltransferase family 1 protein, partial [Bacteroidetes bacterium]|nr:glycosyltransferase family 1 protein [Bacteroidota bacterium]